ncbi:MAG: hypothetical protein ACD_62C00424G0006 [uncultured bacterium]|nr:MAG: hypothetical protein ACD_62C00424G0006 [uncultured bacterium]HLD43838.1 tetratricopeptide repeat protein [bacterium]
MIDVPREDVIVMLEAGYIYLAMKKFKEAKQIFEGICELAPKHDVPLVGVANVYFAQGKYLEAIRILKNTIKGRPQSAFAWAHLGEAQLFYGKRDEALKNLQKASELESGKDGKSGEFARSLLDLMNLGYDPREYRKVFKKFVEEQKQKQET